MRISGSQRYQLSEHLQEVETLLDPIRYDRTIDDAERRRLIDEVLAAANARALSLRGTRRGSSEVAPAEVAPRLDLVRDDRRLDDARRRQRGLARVG